MKGKNYEERTSRRLFSARNANWQLNVCTFISSRQHALDTAQQPTAKKNKKKTMETNTRANTNRFAPKGGSVRYGSWLGSWRGQERPGLAMKCTHARQATRFRCRSQRAHTQRSAITRCGAYSPSVGAFPNFFFFRAEVMSHILGRFSLRRVLRRVLGRVGRCVCVCLLVFVICQPIKSGCDCRYAQQSSLHNSALCVKVRRLTVEHGRRRWQLRDITDLHLRVAAIGKSDSQQTESDRYVWRKEKQWKEIEVHVMGMRAYENMLIVSLTSWPLDPVAKLQCADTNGKKAHLFFY